MTHRIPLLLLGLTMLSAVAASAAPLSRIVDDNDTVPVYGNVHPNARPELDQGPTPQTLRLEHMVLVLEPRAGGREAADRLIAAQHDPASAEYHHWLTPEEYGRRFGISDADLAAVTAWLQRRNLTIDEVAPGRGTINVSGTVAQVERAFRTSIHDYRVDGRTYHANATDPQVPRALADVVAGVDTLHNFPRKPLSHDRRAVSPDYTTSTGAHFLAPADFAKIYDTAPLRSAGFDGTGQTIAVVGRTDIRLTDVQFFRSYFGLPAKDPIVIHNGTSPGDLGGGEEGEADLDVEWAGAVAPGATINFVVSASTATTDGVDLSAQYAVNHNLASVMTTSFGQCESLLGTSENAFFSNLWSQAAAQGITAFIAAGDNGAAGCDDASAMQGTSYAVNGLASTPYDIAVGGTMFDDSTPAKYWSSATSVGGLSVLGYIPELVWNESGSNGGSGLWATGGGSSRIYGKPAWQVAPGVPADARRDVPDVSLSAAGHDGYLVVQNHSSSSSGLFSVGGTSAASPSFAGIMAIVDQKTGQRWGNANTKFYPVAAAQYGGTVGAAAAFHDVLLGNNGVPGVAGFAAGAGYDRATGLGSVDASLLAAAFAPAPPPAPTPVGGGCLACGDANSDGSITTADVFYLVNYLYTGGPAPASGHGDANGDGQVTSTDIFYLVNYLFSGGPAPV